MAELSERNAEQARVIAAQGERIAELARRLAGGGLVELFASAVLGCAVGEEAGQEGFLAGPVGTSLRQAAGGGVLVAGAGR